MTLKEFFTEHAKCALAFSGGTDSALLLAVATHCGADITAYFVKGPFQPRFELEEAKRLATELGARLKVIETDQLEIPEIAANGSERCYYCKRAVFSLIRAEAISDGYSVLIDGSNASDEAGDRPGMRACEELSVLSPLRMCGMTKRDVRSLSRELGLFTADKPSYACLATRIPTGREITREALERVERGEDALRSLGFSNFRIRQEGDLARIEIAENELDRALKLRQSILSALDADYRAVTLDLKCRGA